MKARVAIITEIIAPYRIPVFNALARREDVDPHVMFLSETDPALREWEIRKEEIQFSYQVLPSFRRRVGDFNLLVNYGISKALRKAAPDVLLCGGYSYVASWQAAGWARRRFVPVLLWVESTERDQRRGYAGVEHLKRRFIQLSDGFVVPGRSSAAYVRSFGVADELIFHAPNAVDNDFFSARAMRESARTPQDGLPRKFFLYVGRLIKEKGLFDLLEAYGRLPGELRDEFGLVIAGGGGCRPELELLASRIADGRVVFTGFLQKEQLAALYGKAYAMVFPTHSDTWGLVVNEALASGLPVVVADVAGCSADLVEDGWNGRLVPSQSVEQLIQAMASLARDERLRNKMSVNAREKIRHYSPEACAEGIARAACAAANRQVHV